MLLLVCENCGQKGEIPEDLAAEVDKCPRCGQGLRSAEEIAPDGSVRPFDRLLIAHWKRRGMILGGLLGAGSVLLLWAADGPLPIFGAIAGAMVGFLCAAQMASLGGWDDQSINRDYSLVGLFMIFLLIVTPIGGAYLGTLIEELSTEMLLLAVLGALLIGGRVGAVVGEHQAKKVQAA